MASPIALPDPIPATVTTRITAVERAAVQAAPPNIGQGSSFGSFPTLPAAIVRPTPGAVLATFNLGD